jgi:hypothetical protein
LVAEKADLFKGFRDRYRLKPIDGHEILTAFWVICEFSMICSSLGYIENKLLTVSGGYLEGGSWLWRA